MSKYTPGPWVIHPTTQHPAVRSVGTLDTAPRRICTVGTMNGNPIDIANARLIAAAPELLTALQETLTLFKTFSPQGTAVDRARAVIAKATGETP